MKTIGLPATGYNLLGKLSKEAFQALPPWIENDEVKRLVLAIGYARTGFQSRTLDGKGPSGLWGIGKCSILELISGSRTSDIVAALCQNLGVPFGLFSIHKEMEKDDVLAFSIAALMVWSYSFRGSLSYRKGISVYRKQWRASIHPGIWALVHEKAGDDLRDWKAVPAEEVAVGVRATYRLGAA